MLKTHFLKLFKTAVKNFNILILILIKSSDQFFQMDICYLISSWYFFFCLPTASNANCARSALISFFFFEISFHNLGCF